jgi:protein TonB
MLKLLSFQKPFFRGLGYSVVSLFFIINQNAILAQEMHATNTNPIYPGGENALQKFIDKNLILPAEAGKTGLSGIIEVKFMINKEGKVENIEVMKGISHDCDAEAIRLTGLFQEWIPALRQGKPVNTFVYLPIEFKGDKKVQPTVISGKIVEKNTGLPLDGILVIVKGTNIGSVTSPDGSYRLEVPPEANYLEYMGVGYSPKEVKIDFHSTINVELDVEYIFINFQSEDDLKKDN